MILALIANFLMYANTIANYSQVYYEAITLNIVLFAKLNVCQFALCSNSPNSVLVNYTNYMIFG